MSLSTRVQQNEENLMLDVAIAYIVFNRPHLTEQSFSVIKKLKPSKLFVIADGPRSSFSEDEKLCKKVREITENIDWPCQIHRKYSKNNLGLKKNIGSGLNWVFEHVEDAIILEDDCIPHPDFFTFCCTMLNKYRNDKRIGVITGDNYQNGRRRGDASYYFSKYGHCWGWATWREEWLNYCENIVFWEHWSQSEHWKKYTADQVERQYWSVIFDKVSRGEIDSWAYPWQACLWYNDKLTVTPVVNLVSNIGVGPEATHTKSSRVLNLGQNTGALGQITHPSLIMQNVDADAYTFNYHYGGAKHKFPQIIKYVFFKLMQLFK